MRQNVAVGMRYDRRSRTYVAHFQHSFLRALATCLSTGYSLHECHGRHAGTEPHDDHIQTTVPALRKRGIGYTDTNRRDIPIAPRELDDVSGFVPRSSLCCSGLL